jgi:streptomycin 6-kinase
LSIEIPAALDWLKASKEGREWLDSLPQRVAACVEHWDLALGEPYPNAYVSFTARVRLPDRGDAVLKVPFPDRESEHEALALETWHGDGAVKLLENDPQTGAFLIERCEPGTHLSKIGQQEAMTVLVGLLPRIWKPATAPPFRALAEEAAWWASHLRERWESASKPFPERLLDVTLEALHTLPATQDEQVLLHQDLHGDNVLSAEREPWLVIDPKPLVGEREFGLAPIIRSFEFGHDRRTVLERLDVLTTALGLDRERARLWCVAQTVAWSIGSDYLPHHIETATWLSEA